MADFKLNSEGDLDIEGGLTVVTSYSEEAAQRLKLAIGLNLGEWFADGTFGLPWLESTDEDFSGSIRYILGDKFPDTQRFVAKVLDDYIEQQEYITSVTSTYEFNPDTRVYTYTPTCTLMDGGTLSLTPFQTEL